MKHGVAFIPISYCRGLGQEGRECPPPLTVFTDMPADYKLGARNWLHSSLSFLETWKRKMHKYWTHRDARTTRGKLCTDFPTETVLLSCSHLPLHLLSSHHPTSPSQSASVHKLKVDFKCPIVSALNSHLPHLCHTVLCGSDNGSNYICSMSVLQHSSSSTGRLWHHDAQSRVTSSNALENRSWRAWISYSEAQTPVVFAFTFAHRVYADR